MNTHYRKFAGLCAMAGLAAALLFDILWVVINNRYSDTDGAGLPVVQKAVLILFPASVLKFNTHNVVFVFLDMLAANALLYAVIGSFWWLGLCKNKMFLVPAVAGPVVLWWWLLSL